VVVQTVEGGVDGMLEIENMTVLSGAKITG
jgi:hypothetical protein